MPVIQHDLLPKSIDPVFRSDKMASMAGGTKTCEARML
jgi:hypothetical protein